MQLRTKRGNMTAYAFACGYTEQKGTLTLSQESGTYFVKGFSKHGVHCHYGYPTLTQAHKMLSKLSRLYS